jgi:hypothetical protein
MTGNRIEYYSNTDKFLILNQADTEITDLYYLNKKSYSSQFYSRGKVRTLSRAELTEKLNGQVPFRIIILNKHLKNLNVNETGKLRLIDSNYNRGLYEFHN